VVFTLGNSTDAFLLLRLADVGVAPARVALLWSAFHVVKAVASWAGGLLSDRVGRRPMVASGWLLYAAVYVAFATLTRPIALIGALLAYGLYFGLTEPVERAWIVDLAPPSRRGAALGLYHGAVGIAALPASLLFGAIWQRFGAPLAFSFGAGAALVATLALVAVGHGPAGGAGITRGTAREV
jgi:MFS family permease